MTEEYWAECFNRQVDGLISDNGETPPSGAPANFHEALQMAGNLAQLNFSAESQQRDVLRRRLLAQAHQIQEAQMKTLRWRRTLIWSIVGTVAVLGLTLTLFYPGGVAAATQQVIETIRNITLGPYASAVQVAPHEEADRPRRPDTWLIRTEIGNFGGNLTPSDVEPVVQSFATREEAQTAAGTPIMIPSYLPDGYVLREIKVAQLSDNRLIISFYSGPARDIIIAQLPGGPLPGVDPQEGHGVSNGIGTTGALEETDLDGRTAAWVDSKTLAWSVDNTTYEVGGIDLTLAEAKQIARSLR
jgi:hypothetical protein